MKYLEHCLEQTSIQKYWLLLSPFLEQYIMRGRISQSLLSPKTGFFISCSWSDLGMSIQPVSPSWRALLFTIIIKITVWLHCPLVGKAQNSKTMSSLFSPISVLISISTVFYVDQGTSSYWMYNQPLTPCKGQWENISGASSLLKETRFNHLNWLLNSPFSAVLGHILLIKLPLPY